jgi:hypothetical protein
MSQPPFPPPPSVPQGPTAPTQVWAPAPNAGGPQGWDPGQPPYPPAAPAAGKPFYTKPWFIVVAGLVAVGAVGSALDGEKTETAADTAPVKVTVTQEAPPATTEAEQSQAVEAPETSEAETAPAAPAVDFTMPNFVGMDLQTAQNLVQDNGVFLSLSHDLLGSRNQIVDSNWMVCDQNIAAGEHVTGDVEGQIDFGVVKRGEPCP